MNLQNLDSCVGIVFIHYGVVVIFARRAINF